MGVAGEAGAGGFGAVVGPECAVVPHPDQLTPHRFQSGGFGGEADDEVMNRRVIKGVGVETGERIECLVELVENPGPHPPMLSN